MGIRSNSTKEQAVKNSPSGPGITLRSLAGVISSKSDRKYSSPHRDVHLLSGCQERVLGFPIDSQ